jgi:hypothetical protein
VKTVLILGAKSDIAKAIAQKFSNNDFQVTLAARGSNELVDFAKSIQTGNNKVNTVDFDAINYKSHSAFFNGLAVKPDVVVLCVGYLGDQEKAQNEFEETEKLIDTNYTGPVSILEIVAKDMEEKGAGAIIGISSVAGDRGRQSNYIYGSSKAAFSAYLSGLRQRLAKRNVTVLTVKPGFVNTKMTAGLDLPPKLTAQPVQVAEQIYQSYKSGKNVVYTKPIWRPIMFIIRNIPEFLFKKLNF